MNSRDINILLLFTSFFFENWNVLEYRYNFLSDLFGEKKKKNLLTQLLVWVTIWVSIKKEKEKEMTNHMHF